VDINSLANTQSLLAATKSAENTLNLKVGQQLDVKVITADIQAAKNAVTLSLGDKDITVQSNQPIALKPGQDLKIQVTQVTPAIEFKVLEASSELKKQITQLQGPNSQASELRLKLIAAIKDGGTAAVAKESVRPTANEQQNSAVLSLPAKQLLEAKIISVIGNKIQLQVFNPSTVETGNKQAVLINVDRTRLTNAPSNLKAGQSLNLEIVKTGTAPEFKIIPAGSNIPEAKVAEFIKQFLPRHEASPIFLNQLIKDLPQLMKNESVPQALKEIAAKIVQNLPPKEQLISSQGLKQAITNSGLFLEAKLPPAMSQIELIKELPQLIKNESVPQSLQRIANEILQNLTQKQPLPNSPNLEQPAAHTKPVSVAESALSKLNPADAAKSALKMGFSGDIELIAGDFKANLLKFVQALKQEITHQGDQPLNQVDVDLLKNLQHKTENTVAKLVLDQLMSLPKEDNPKQLWIIDIPFIDRQQAESVRIEVQQDKENKHQSGNGDWSVNITITPPGLGTIHCIVSYNNGVINTFFKSRNTQTTELIKHNLDYLKNQLEESGLKTGHMDAHDGVQKTPAAHPHQLSGKKLFDDKA
jgi:uncharacterized protein (UPF0147 family)